MTVVQKAAKGQRGALQTLYKSNKAAVFAIARCLLLDEQQAAAATVQIFAALWNELSEQTSVEFAALAVQKTAAYCKQLRLKKDPKAYRIPQNRSFLLTANEIAPRKDANATDAVLETLPDLHRLIFVLHAIGGFDRQQLAAITKLDAKTLETALETAPQNIEHILRAAGSQMTCAEWTEALTDGAASLVVPPQVDEQVDAQITALVKPRETRRFRRLIIAAVVAVVCLCAVGGICAAMWPHSEQNTANTDSITTDGTTYYADIDIADYGTITVALDADAAPITVANFVSLARSGFYDGLTFHRIIEGFMMQGGDPTGTGTSGSSETIVGEFSSNGYENPLSHTRGAISMARNSLSYDSASSQFFIVQEDSTYLDGDYAVFGYVTEGMEVVDAVCEAAQPTDSNGTIAADEQPIINSITIREQTADAE